MITHEFDEETLIHSIVPIVNSNWDPNWFWKGLFSLSWHSWEDILEKKKDFQCKWWYIFFIFILIGEQMKSNGEAFRMRNGLCVEVFNTMCLNFNVFLPGIVVVVVGKHEKATQEIQVPFNLQKFILGLKLYTSFPLTCQSWVSWDYSLDQASVGV